MTMTAPATTVDEIRHPAQLVALPPLRLQRASAIDADDDARYWLTTKGAIEIDGIDRVSLVPGLDEIVRWDHDAQRWVRL